MAKLTFLIIAAVLFLLAAAYLYEDQDVECDVTDDCGMAAAEEPETCDDCTCTDTGDCDCGTVVVECSLSCDDCLCTDTGGCEGCTGEACDRDEPVCEPGNPDCPKTGD
ncbi:hypothetical protein KAU45_03390 [bacterium]|nr:hypothetical protein [bacterium]